MAHLMMKFPVEDETQRVIRVGVVRGDKKVARRCYVQSVRAVETHKRVGDERKDEDMRLEHKRRKEGDVGVTEYETGELLSIERVLKDNKYMYAWRPEDMVGIDPKVVVHKLNIRPGAKLIK